MTTNKVIRSFHIGLWSERRVNEPISW